MRAHPVDTLRKRPEAGKVLNPEKDWGTRKESSMCRELDLVLLDSEGKKLERENEARSPQSHKLLGATWA